LTVSAEFSQRRGNEGRAVVAFQNQRLAVDHEQDLLMASTVVCALTGAGVGQPEQHLAIGQVAHGQ
jgi:hypothetical protein